MTNDLVSVIMPSRNRPKLFPAAVRSALAQTHPSIEVHLIDDASETPYELPEDLASDPRVYLHRLESHRGISVARNHGVARSEGRFIAFLDDDDRWLPQKIEKQMALLRSNPEWAGVDTGYETQIEGKPILRFVPDLQRDLKLSLLREASISISTVLMTREAFEHVGGFDPEMTLHEDWELWLRVTDEFRIGALPEIHMYRRDHRASATATHWFRQEILAHIEPRLRGVPDKEVSAIRAYHRFVSGVLLVEMRDRRGRRLLWQAWCQDPTLWRALLQMIRSFVSEELWTKVTGGLRAIVHALMRRAGRDPLAQRW